MPPCLNPCRLDEHWHRPANLKTHWGSAARECSWWWRCRHRLKPISRQISSSSETGGRLTGGQGCAGRLLTTCMGARQQCMRPTGQQPSAQVCHAARHPVAWRGMAWHERTSRAAGLTQELGGTCRLVQRSLPRNLEGADHACRGVPGFPGLERSACNQCPQMRCCSSRQLPKQRQFQQPALEEAALAPPTEMVVGGQPAHAIPLHGVVAPRGIERQALPVERKVDGRVGMEQEVGRCRSIWSIQASRQADGHKQAQGGTPSAGLPQRSQTVKCCM